MKLIGRMKRQIASCDLQAIWRVIRDSSHTADFNMADGGACRPMLQPGHCVRLTYSRLTPAPPPRADGPGGIAIAVLVRDAQMVIPPYVFAPLWAQSLYCA